MLQKKKDIEMFDRILNDSNLLCDFYKIYPCVATDFTMIKKWADEGKYIPNADKDKDYLQDVIGHYMKNVQPWVRILELYVIPFLIIFIMVIRKVI